MSRREPILNWPVVAAIVVVGALIWALNAGVWRYLNWAFDGAGYAGLFGAGAAALACIFTYAYVVDRRAGNLPDWLRPQDQRRPPRD